MNVYLSPPTIAACLTALLSVWAAPSVLAQNPHADQELYGSSAKVLLFESTNPDLPRLRPAQLVAPDLPSGFSADLRVAASDEAEPDQRIAGSDILIERLLPDLLDYIARVEGADLARGGSQKAGWRYTFDDAQAGVFARAVGASRALESLIAGESDFALVTRPIRAEEATALIPGGIDALRAARREHVLASDGMVVVVDRAIGVEEISIEDLARIYAGEIRNWSALGGPDVPITPFVRESGSATRDLLTEMVMVPNGRSLSPHVIGVDNDKGVADAVVAFPGSLGVTSYYSAAGARILRLREECGLVAEANPFTIQTGRYPLTRHLYAYEHPDFTGEGLGAALIAFARSEQGQEALNDMGYVTQRITTEGLEAQRARLAEAMAIPPQAALLAPLRDMVETLISAERLSPTFRIEAPGGGVSLAKAHADRLAEEILAGAFEGRELLLVGFVDQAADASAGLAESLRAAEAIRVAVEEALPKGFGIEIKTFGYGTLAPLACRGTARGAEINRRVELWARPIREE